MDRLNMFKQSFHRNGCMNVVLTAHFVPWITSIAALQIRLRKLQLQTSCPRWAKKLSRIKYSRDWARAQNAPSVHESETGIVLLGGSTQIFDSLWASFCFVSYLHYRRFVRIADKYNRASVVFAVVPCFMLALLQRFPAFWTIDHFHTPCRVSKEE